MINPFEMIRIMGEGCSTMFTLHSPFSTAEKFLFEDERTFSQTYLPFNKVKRRFESNKRLNYKINGIGCVCSIMTLIEKKLKTSSREFDFIFI